MRTLRAAFGMVAGAASVLAQIPPTITSVVNAALTDSTSAANRLCPGALATIYGANLGSNTTISVQVGGKQAAVLSAQLNQLSFQVPVDAPIGTDTLAVGSGAQFPLTIVPFAPAIFTGVNGQAQATHKDGSAVDDSHPAVPGEIISVYANGLGPTTPAVGTGQTPAQGNPASLVSSTTVTATVGSQSAKVISATLSVSQVGLYQVVIQLPSAGVPSGPQPVQLSISGAGVASPVASNNPPLSFAGPDNSGPLVLENNYSFIPPGLPNYGIAQGSIFVIYGANLAPGSTPLQNPPLKTTLNGVTVNVTVNGVTTHPPIYYLGSGQLGVILPSNTPVGDGQIAVVNNGATVGPAPIHVVPSAFGLMSLNGVGTGMAAMFDASFNLVTFTNSVRAGEVVNLWGSGIGPSPDSDQNPIPAPTNLVGAIPVEVTVGGKVAQVSYAGRSQYPGLDQLQITVPQGVTPGCFVSVVVRAGTMVSNFGSMPIASSGRACAESTLGLTSTGLQLVSAAGSFAVGSISMGKQVTSIPGTLTPSFFSDQVSASFLRFTTDSFARYDINQPSIGSCAVFSYTGSPAGPSSGAYSPALLDAGPSLNVGGPSGKATVPVQNGTYSGTVGGSNGSSSLPLFIPASGGTTFTFDNGTGGADVKAFAATVSSLGPTLAWTNQNAITIVNRGGAPALQWTGGSGNVYALISGYSTGSGNSGAGFVCATPSTDGQFTIPATVLLALPATRTESGNGELALSFYQLPQSFTASGIDFGFLTLYQQLVSVLSYQ